MKSQTSSLMGMMRGLRSYDGPDIFFDGEGWEFKKFMMGQVSLMGRYNEL